MPWPLAVKPVVKTGVLLSISPTFFAHLFCQFPFAKKNWKVWKSFHTKELLVKCWWNINLITRKMDALAAIPALVIGGIPFTDAVTVEVGVTNFWTLSVTRFCHILANTVTKPRCGSLIKKMLTFPVTCKNTTKTHNCSKKEFQENFIWGVWRWWQGWCLLKWKWFDLAFIELIAYK